jgi:RNA polymerase-associated protein
MPIDPLSRARLRLAMSRLEQEWIPELDAIAAGSRAESEAARKRMRELVQASLPLFKASRFFLNTELSLADCALAPILWRLPALGIDLARDAKPIEDYAQRIFRSPIFVRSLLPEERHYRELPA